MICLPPLHRPAFTLALLLGACSGEVPPPPEIHIAVDLAVRHAISPYIYGVNAWGDQRAWAGAAVRGATLTRAGGNRWSAYNWTNNASNAGRDWQFENDAFLSASSVPGDAVRSRVSPALSEGVAALVTVPLLGFVARDEQAVRLDTSDATRAARLTQHFVPSLPRKGAPFTLRPDARSPAVFQDEFVNWMMQTFNGAVSATARTPIFISLDNEPDDWHRTHKEIQSDVRDDPSTPRLQTYDGFIRTTTDYALAIRSVAPHAVIFGPAVASYAGLLTLGRDRHPDPAFPDWHMRPFLDVYLDALRDGAARFGQPLVDVLDVHWYPAGDVVNDRAQQTPDVIQSRLQAPRSLWDPAFDEHTWVSSTAHGPVRLIPYLREHIARHNPGMRIAISEYYFGRAGDISGGIAQADALGIFGREGVFAAALWPQADVLAVPYMGSGERAYAYALGALRMYRNYDGAGGRFGDVGVQAVTSDRANSSVFASVDSLGRVVMVVINKQPSPQAIRVEMAHAPPLRTAQVFELSDGSPAPAPKGTLPVTDGHLITYTMPALSISTLVAGP